MVNCRNTAQPSMYKITSLSDYVKSVNGVPLGHPKSLRKMLYNSFGAYSFSAFWKYWNPIWSYYLRYFVYRPLRNYLPQKIDVLITFLISGGIHDLAVKLLTSQWSLTITTWFAIMALVVVLESYLHISLKNVSLPIRAMIFLTTIAVSYLLARLLLTF